MNYKKIYACINTFRKTGDSIYIDEIKGDKLSPVYFIDGDNFGVLMPMRRTQQ